MLALFLAIMAAVWLIEATSDQSSTNIHASVVFVRTGERTPILAGDDQVLSALGAQQMHSLGQNFRTRYLNNDSGPGGLGVQPILGLSPNILDHNQLLIQTLDMPYLLSSAQAFMQGLYPPYSINTTQGVFGDATGILSNGSVIDFPLGGYQYAPINTASLLKDPDSVYLGGDQECPVSQVDSSMYETTPQYQQTKAMYEEFYTSLDVNLFDGHLAKSQLDYMYASDIYEYLAYAYEHDSEVYEKFNNNSLNAGKLDQLRYLADEKAWYEYGNTSALTTDGDYQAMGGKTLSALILESFQDIVDNRGNTTNGSAHALTVLFGEYEPMVSLFSLMMVDHVDELFRSVPPFGSAIVFELYSEGTNGFPSDLNDLRVQFYYQNGTQFDGSLTPHPMFEHGPSVTALPWEGFKNSVSNVMVSTLQEWCTTCNSPAEFCWGVVATEVLVVNSYAKTLKLTPTVAGVIGAVVTLFAAGLIFAIVLLIGGFRFHRVDRNRKSDLGGFKGSAKLASDADLSIVRHAPALAPVAAGITSFGDKDGAVRKTPHERVGSWELRQKEFDQTGELNDESRGGSFENIEAAMHGPVEPHVGV